MAHPPADHQRPVILCVALAPQPSQDSPAQYDRIPQRQIPHDRWSIPAANAGGAATDAIVPARGGLRRRWRSSPPAGWVRPSRVVGRPDPNRAGSAGGRTRPCEPARRPPQTNTAGRQIWAGLGLVPSSTARRRRYAWPAARLIHDHPCGRCSGRGRTTARGSDRLRVGLLLLRPPGLQHRQGRVENPVDEHLEVLGTPTLFIDGVVHSAGRLRFAPPSRCCPAGSGTGPG